MDADLAGLYISLMHQACLTGFHTRDEMIPEAWGCSMPPWCRNVHDTYRAVVGYNVLVYHIKRRKS